MQPSRRARSTAKASGIPSGGRLASSSLNNSYRMMVGPQAYGKAYGLAPNGAPMERHQATAFILARSAAEAWVEFEYLQVPPPPSPGATAPREGPAVGAGLGVACEGGGECDGAAPGGVRGRGLPSGGCPGRPRRPPPGLPLQEVPLPRAQEIVWERMGGR